MAKKCGIGKACGKIILVGEHSVLYGSAAIAVPVLNSSFYCRTEINNENKIITFQQNIKKIITKEESESLFKLVSECQKRLKQKDGLTLSFYSKINNRSGMGSSAAMAVSIVRSIYDLYEKPLDVEELVEIAKISEDVIHGKSSGIDINVIARNEVIYFKQLNNKIILEPLNVKHSLSFLLINTKKQSSTEKAVKQVAEIYKENKNEFEHKFSRIDEIATKIKNFLTSENNINYFEFNKLLNENHKILKDLGLAAENENKIRKIINQTTQSYGYKVTGAGLGGYNLLFCNIKQYDKIKSDLESENYRVIQATIFKKVTTSAHPNIALIKYWGKRNDDLILPYTESLSLTLEPFKTTTTISYSVIDEIYINNKNVIDYKILNFLNKFRQLYQVNRNYKIITTNDFPTAAGLASSSSGYAALAKGLSKLNNLNLNTKELSILARLGSGSASRSIQGGINIWRRGNLDNGEDSFAIKIADNLPWDIKIVAIIINNQEKEVSSRIAMEETVKESPFYSGWKKIVERDMIELNKAIKLKRFDLFGESVERNSLAMHSTIAGCLKPKPYLNSASYKVIETIKNLRDKGTMVYWTADAGPNIKVITRTKDLDVILKTFKNYKIHVLQISKDGVKYE
jgi:diphosphomevalonate decarboxylase